MTTVTTQHGLILPGDGTGQANHTIEGLEEVADETALAALAATLGSTARGKVVYQTAGLAPGWYIFSGAAFTLLQAAQVVPLNNDAAVVDPAPTDDSDSNYRVGSRWTNTATGEVWRCIDATVGAAIWVTTGRVLRQEPSGFENPGSGSGTTMTYTDATRTFQIEPSGVSYEVWIAGRKLVKTAAETVVWPDTEGPIYIGFDAAGALEARTDSPSVWVEGAGAHLTTILWDAANGVSTWRGDHRHGLIDGAVHRFLEDTIGAQLVGYGAELTDILADDTGASDTHAQFAVADATYRDADMVHTVSGLDTAPAQIPIFWRSGANGDWRRKAPDNFPLIYSGDGSGYVGASGRPAWNQLTGGVWQLTEAANNSWFLVHYVLTADKTYGHGVVGLLGQQTYGTKPLAEAGALVELKALALGPGVGNIAQSSVFIASVIFKAATTFVNTPKARIESTAAGNDYVDWRLLRGISFAG